MNFMPNTQTTPETIEKQEKDVQEYLAWIDRTDHELEEAMAPLRLKPVNRKVVETPVY